MTAKRPAASSCGRSRRLAAFWVILFDAHGREVVMSGATMAVQATALQLGAAPGEITFLPKVMALQRVTIDQALRALYAIETNVMIQSSGIAAGGSGSATS